QVWWGVIGVGAGFGLGRNRRNAFRRATEAWREYVAPRVEQARWRARHDVTMDEEDAGSPHNLKKDLLTLHAYGSATAEAARRQLMSRKLDLAAQTDAFGAYLGDVSAGLVLDPPGAWSIRLAPTQVEALRNALGDD